MPTNIIPRAPRALIQPRSHTAVPSPQQIQDDISERLYPRMVLYEALVRFKDKPERRQHSGNEICEARRDFLDAFAGICDVRKRGATVTATGLHKGLSNHTLWLAANEGIGIEIKDYAENILQKLKEINPETQTNIQVQIFQLVVEKCRPRIEFYRREMQRYAIRCRMRLKYDLLDPSAGSLRSELRKPSEQGPNVPFVDLVKYCYNLRGPLVEQVRAKSKSSDDEFSKLAHFIGRVGSTRSMVNSIIQGTSLVPDLRRISEVRTVRAHEVRRVTISESSLSPYEIVRVICQESTSINPTQIQAALHAIVELDMPLNGNLRDTLASWIPIETRAHAELQIADQFSRHKYMEFVGDDKYIGCSKPACYFCYNWLSSHKHTYIPPATHHKIIPGCLGPDNGINVAGTNFLDDMYAKIGRRLDQDIIGFLLLDSQQKMAFPRRQYMSTEGSSRAPSQFGGGLL